MSDRHRQRSTWDGSLHALQTLTQEGSGPADLAARATAPSARMLAIKA